MTGTPVPGLAFERRAWRAGARAVAGVDEVGVGPLAGPVVGGAVLLPRRRKLAWYAEVRDSKVLPPARRETLAAAIAATVPWGVGWVSHEEIDAIGILPARRLCMMRALEGLPVAPCHVISDALDLPLPSVEPVIHGDALSVAVAAASIVAKVARDAHMVKMCALYPGYGFCRHKGYATAEHRRLLQERGPSPIHRRSFAPVAQSALAL